MKKKPKVFIVDDQPKNIQLLREILKELSCDIYAALDGKKALVNIKKSQPDLILLDIRMPGLDGFDVCRTLKADKVTASIPVVFLSALDTIEDKNRAFEAGAVDYIAKPFNTLEARARIKTHLKNSLSFYRQNMLLKKVFHELYTPLSVISTGVDLVRLKHSDSKELVNIMAAVRTLHYLYDDLYYSIKARQEAPPSETIDLKPFIRGRIDYFSVMAKAREVVFTLACEEGTYPVLMHASDLERVVDNTLANAVKYSHKGKTVAVAVAKEEETIRFFVTNEGNDVSDVKTLFSPFFQEDAESEGVGLGLTIVKHICDENRIGVHIESDKGMTTFRYVFQRSETI